jgi:NAD(P)-dependent dehydrogenase (short-subunit alcohol dehydrogenase family)
MKVTPIAARGKLGAAALIAAAEDADILVNNLGTARPKPFAEITDEDWMNLFQFNVSGAAAGRRRRRAVCGVARDL